MSFVILSSSSYANGFSVWNDAEAGVDKASQEFCLPRRILPFSHDLCVFPRITALDILWLQLRLSEKPVARFNLKYCFLGRINPRKNQFWRDKTIQWICLLSLTVRNNCYVQSQENDGRGGGRKRGGRPVLPRRVRVLPQKRCINNRYDFAQLQFLLLKLIIISKDVLLPSYSIVSVYIRGTQAHRVRHVAVF